MKKFLFFVIFCVAMFAVGCSDPHKNLEDFPEIIPDEPEIVMPEDSIQDASSNSDDPSVEPEVEEFEFDVSKLTPSKYSDIIESDPTLLSLNPTVVKKDSLVDIEISYGREDLFTTEEIDGEFQRLPKYGDKYFYLEIFIDGVWYNISSVWESYIPEQYWDYGFAFPDVPVPLDSCPAQTLYMTTAFQNLPVGRYRIVKDVDGWKYAEFVIE